MHPSTAPPLNWLLTGGDVADPCTTAWASAQHFTLMSSDYIIVRSTYSYWASEGLHAVAGVHELYPDGQRRLLLDCIDGIRMELHSSGIDAAALHGLGCSTIA